MGDDSVIAPAPPPSKSSSLYDKHVGAQLRTARVARGLSQELLGRHLGVTCQQIQKYERGANRVSAGRLYESSLLLGVDVNYFFDGLGREEPRGLPLEDAATILSQNIAHIGNAQVRTRLIALIEALASA